MSISYPANVTGVADHRVLDAGYVRLVEVWGSEERIIEAARMSTGRGFQGWDKDSRLLAYLYKHQHWTPFEMAGLVLEVKAPIFVFREWHRHRTQSYNELSARYTPLPDENYIPDLQDVLDRANKATPNKQAQTHGVPTAPLSSENAYMWLQELQDLYDQAQKVYEHGLALGIPKELARLPVPVARYSRMRANANLRNWLAFLRLRLDVSAQAEIRAYANAVAALVAENFPRTWQLFSEEK